MNTVEAVKEQVSVPSTRKIHPSRFASGEVVRNVWSITPEHGTKFEDLLEPSYWAHVAKTLRPTDRIEVRAEDGSYFAELYVRGVTSTSARVALLRKVEFDQKDDPEAIGFSVQWKGPHHKWAVVRDSDRQTVSHGSESREEAMQWLALNSRALMN